MSQLAKLLVGSFALAAIIVVQSPVRAVAQEVAPLINSADEALISEFSAATKHHPTRRAKTHQARGGKSIKHGASSRKTTKMGARHKSGKVATGKGAHKPGKVSSQFNKKGVSKMGDGPGKLANRPGKMSDGPGKLGAGPAGAGTDGKVFMDNMGPSNTAPSTQNAQTPQKKSPRTHRSPAVINALINSKELKPFVDEVRRDWPKATPAQILDTAVGNKNRRRIAEQKDAEAKLAAIKAKEAAAKAKAQADADTLAAINAEEAAALAKAKYNTPEMIERRRKDNEDTNRKRADQEADEHQKWLDKNNPGRDKVDPKTGVDKDLLDDMNRKTLPGKRTE